MVAEREGGRASERASERPLRPFPAVSLSVPSPVAPLREFTRRASSQSEPPPPSRAPPSAAHTAAAARIPACRMRFFPQPILFLQVVARSRTCTATKDTFDQGGRPREKGRDEKHSDQKRLFGPGSRDHRFLIGEHLSLHPQGFSIRRSWHQS